MRTNRAEVPLSSLPRDEVRHYHCSSCPGNGRALQVGYPYTRCSTCQGTGIVDPTPDTTWDNLEEQIKCSGCGGEGFLLPPIPDTHECAFCGQPTTEITEVTRIGLPVWPEPQQQPAP